MNGLLLLALTMTNIPVYLVIGRVLFGTWERFAEAIRLWASLELLRSPFGGEQEHVSTDMRLGGFLACSAGAVLAEFFLLTTLVLHTAL
jgi:hypothetical protein